MKKYLILILTIALIFTMTACGTVAPEPTAEPTAEPTLTPEEDLEARKTYYKLVKFDDSIIPEECNCTIVKITSEDKNITVSYGFNYYTIAVNNVGMELVARDGKVYLHTMQKGETQTESWVCATIESGNNPFAESIIESYKDAIDLSSVMGIDFLETIELDGVKYDYVQVKTLVSGKDGEETVQKEAVVEVYFYSETKKLAKIVSKLETAEGLIPAGAMCEITYENVQEIAIPDGVTEMTYVDFTKSLTGTMFLLAAQLM